MKEKQGAIHNLLPLAVLPLILAVCLGLWANLIPDDFTKVESESGVWDLSGMELSNTFVTISGLAEQIPLALLTPAEFSAREGEAVIGNTQHQPYLTSRMRILLPDDGWYTFTRVSIDYSERVFVNGELLLDVGKTGDSVDTAVPDTARITFTARPVNGIIEIVQQSSNFVHREGGYHFNWHVGGLGLITYIRNVDFIASIILGCFLSLILIYALLFFMLRGYKANLYFALFCLMWFLRSGVTGAKIFSAVFPGLSWYAKFRMEYIALPVAVLLTVAMINALFPLILQKAFSRIVYVVSAGFAALFLLADTLMMSRAILVLYVLYGLAILYIAVRFVMKLRGVKLEQGVFLAGAALFLFSANRLKTELVDTVSHEARTPLAVLSSYAGLVSMELKDKGADIQISADLDRVVFEAKRVANLIDSMQKLTLSSGESAKRVRLDILDVVRQTAELYRHILTRAGVSLTLEAAENLPPVLGRPDKLTQMLLNLLQNAKNHTEHGGVTIRVKSAGDSVAVIIADTGAGIAPELLPHVFERGVSGSGSGIGLNVLLK